MSQMTTLWIVAGLLLLIGEMLTVSFFMLFLSIGCFAAAIVSNFETSVLLQSATCATVSILGMAALRKPLQTKLFKKVSMNSDLGKELVLDQPLGPHQQSRISYQGSSWLAMNLEPEGLQAGDRVVIVGMDGNTLLVRKVN